MKLGWHWKSCDRFTILVGVDDDGIIRKAPPIVRRFIGQHVVNLSRWMGKLGGYRTCYLGTDERPLVLHGSEDLINEIKWVKQ